MDKINIKNVITSILDDLQQNKLIKKYATQYPSNWVKLPLVVYKTTSKPYAVDSKGNELQTAWTINFELYAKESLTEIQNKLTEHMTTIGFRGTKADANTGNLSRVVCEYTAVVDNVTRRVYKYN